VETASEAANTLLTREEVALAILGTVKPCVRLSHDFKRWSAAPHAAVAMTADTPEEAKDLAIELAGDIAKGFPAWRGWGIEYSEPASQEKGARCPTAYGKPYGPGACPTCTPALASTKEQKL
jgi:hypothetical protein